MGIASMNYSVSARDVLDHRNFGKKLAMMRAAGLDTLWITGYYFGRHESSTEEMYRARLIVEGEGLSTGVISLPVGHPGNSLNPDDPTLELAINPKWHYRVKQDGEKEYFCACIDEQMISDNRAAALEYKQAGFTRHFFDDDLRTGAHGDEVRGCFCESCIRRFNAKHGLSLDRGQLADACSGKAGMEDIREAWIQFNCDAVTGFMRDTRIPGMTSGIMVMHNGGRYHGISIPDIKEVVPDCMFRVGEYHFDDAKYTAPQGKESLAASVRSHLALIGSNPAYSESTIFPAAALSPENLIDKIKLEISLGLRNIFLMGGSWFITEPYWKALKENLSELNELCSM